MSIPIDIYFREESLLTRVIVLLVIPMALYLYGIIELITVLLILVMSELLIFFVFSSFMVARKHKYYAKLLFAAFVYRKQFFEFLNQKNRSYDLEHQLWLVGKNRNNLALNYALVYLESFYSKCKTFLKLVFMVGLYLTINILGPVRPMLRFYNTANIEIYKLSKNCDSREKYNRAIAWRVCYLAKHVTGIRNILAFSLYPFFITYATSDNRCLELLASD